jgi:hypothetical protein
MLHANSLATKATQTNQLASIFFTPISTSSMVVITMLVLSIEDIFAIDVLLPLVKPQKILIRFSFYFILQQ